LFKKIDIDRIGINSFDGRIDAMNVAAGKTKANTVVVGGKLVNVHTGRIEKCDVAISDKRIAAVGNVDYTIGSDTKIIDADGCFICPGFIDAHIHIDDSLLTVTGFTKLAIPTGTLTVIQDSHEIGNALGMKGVLLYRKEAKRVPLRVFFTAPSSVPSVPSFETTMEIDHNDVLRLLKFSDTVGLAEVMDYLGIIDGQNAESIYKIQLTIERGKAVDGHFSNLSGKDLQAYTAVGNQSDHEARTSEQVKERLSAGLWTMINGGRIKDELRFLVEGDTDIDTRHILLDTDDRHAGDIDKFGLMDYNIREVIKLGVSPVKAIQMGTLNTAEYFGLDRDLGSIGPGKFADLVIVDGLESFNVKKVILDGNLVAEDGKLLIKVKEFRYPKWAKDSIKIKKGFNVKDLEIRAPQKVEIQARISIIPTLGKSSFIETLKVANDIVQPDIEKDIVKMAVIERYGKNGNIGLGFVFGTGIKTGALAASITHDSHNISVAGVSDQDMYFAVKRLEQIHGGYVVVNNGKVLEELALPIGGIITEDTEEAIEKQDRLREAAKSIGLNPPFLRTFGMTYALPGYPGRGNRGDVIWTITDVGLVDYVNRRLLDVIVS